METTRSTKKIPRQWNFHQRSLECVNVEVVLGNPLKKCRGVGICKMDVLQENALFPACDCTFKVRGALSCDKENSMLYLVINQSNLSSAVMDAYFSMPNFRIEASLFAPANLAKLLGFSRFEIPPGYYPIINTGNLLTIYFIGFNPTK